MIIGNEKYKITNCLRFNLFTPVPWGVKLILPAPGSTAGSVRLSLPCLPAGRPKGRGKRRSGV